MQETKQMRIYNLLKERIESGFYPSGHLFPDELKLAKELSVSRVTLRPALELLKLENLIIRQRGRGTFVRDLRTANNRILVLFSAQTDPSEKASNPYGNLYQYIFDRKSICSCLKISE